MPTVCRIFLFIAALAASGAVVGAEVVKRVERLLPEETLAMVSVGDVPQLIAAWNRLGFRPPLVNPALRAAIWRIEEQLPPQWRESGPDWADLLSLPTGEACLAVVESKSGKPVIVLGMEVRDRGEKAAGLLGQLGCGQKVAGPTPAETSLGGTRILQYPGLAWFVKDDLLVAATDPDTTLDMLRSWPGTGALLAGAEYRAVMQQCDVGTTDVEPEIRCFVRPVPYLAARIGSEKRNPPVTARQFLDQARQTGFDAIRAAAGVAWFDRGRHALDYRVAVHAPDRTTTAMRMLNMPNRPSHEPPAWIPGDAAGYCSFSWEMQQSFAPFATLFDLVVAEVADGQPGLLEDLLTAIAKDPLGPKIDLREEFIHRLGTRVLVVCDAEKPAASVWDRGVFAFEVTDEAAVARALGKYWNAATDYRQRDIGGHVVYEALAAEEPEELEPPLPVTPAVDPDSIPPNTPPNSDKASAAETKPVGPVLITVAHGFILWGNNRELFELLLRSGESSLAADPGYRVVAEELDRLAAGPASFRSFSRCGDDFRLLARCMAPERLYTPFFLESQEWVREKQLDTQPPSSLPPGTSSTVGPAGWLAYSLPDGWRIVGFVLAAAPPQEQNR